ncbi:MAG: replication factor C small subunit [Candidatus Aenigmarchaeota archaeon]|nr:replication factor C small subunit [Candidatus Aenigmarchaeota archaeon]
MPEGKGFEIWTEKYRPASLDDVVNQRHVVERLKAWVKEKNVPNMLFAGPPGCGKTTAAVAVAREIFGPRWRENFSDTNASDERGIDVVRGRVKDFARTKPIGADFRIMFLDEADALTPEAQQALRRTMEQFSSVCRFVLSCNYSSRIIEPIQSRTAVFRFRRLLKDDVAEYIRRIAHNEKFEVEKDAIDAIYDASEGDLRKATNILQACAMHKKVTAKIVYEISSMVHPKEIREMIGLAIGKKFEDSRKKLHEMMTSQGLAAEDIVRGIHREIYSLDVEEEGKLRLIDKLADAEFRINMGASPDIQLEAFLACCIGIPARNNI